MKREGDVRARQINVRPNPAQMTERLHGSDKSYSEVICLLSLTSVICQTDQAEQTNQTDQALSGGNTQDS